MMSLRGCARANPPAIVESRGAGRAEDVEDAVGAAVPRGNGAAVCEGEGFGTQDPTTTTKISFRIAGRLDER